MIAVGIDPGASGAIAVIDTDSGKAYGHVLDTKDVLELASLLDAARNWTTAPIHVGVELVNAMPGGGTRRMGATSAFQFGRASMGPEAVCALKSLPWSYVAPRDWHALALAGRGKGADPRERKRLVMDAARARWPYVPLKRAKDQAVADALWIAFTVARRETGRETAA